VTDVSACAKKGTAPLEFKGTVSFFAQAQSDSGVVEMMQKVHAGNQKQFSEFFNL
jgi:hypothetical protein